MCQKGPAKEDKKRRTQIKEVESTIVDEKKWGERERKKGVKMQIAMTVLSLGSSKLKKVKIYATPR